MDAQAFELLLRNIEGIKTDLQADISDLKTDLSEHKKESKVTLEKINEQMTAHNKFKWKLSGAAMVFTIMFQGLLAWIQRGSGKT